MSLIKKNNFCNNCGKQGHVFHQCKIPITSIGVITIRRNETTGNVEVLLICRKDSLAFVDFMRGKYNLDDKKYILNLFNKMTIKEREFIFNNEFHILWNYLWGTNIINQYRNEEKTSKLKFNQLKNGYAINNDFYNLENIISLCSKSYTEPEWGFPKGRRNYQERDIMCGLREFEEETGYDKSNINIINNIIPLEEIFTGSNYKSYKHKYFLGYIENPIVHNNFQKSEVSDMQWLSLEDCLTKIRPYNLERIELINNINKVLHKYSLIS